MSRTPRPSRTAPTPGALALALLLAACHPGGNGAPEPSGALALVAGMTELDPEPGDDLSPQFDLRRMGMVRPQRVYELTTPPAVPFAFDLITSAPGNAGSVGVSVAHVADGQSQPAGGTGTLAAAGLALVGGGMGQRPPWLDASGDGFARMTVRGAIERDQVIAVDAHNGQGTATALVRIAIGAPSPINQVDSNGGNHPGVVAQQTLYSSDSWQFGLPTVAVSGDRTSIVVYEGDRRDPTHFHRYELRMQHDAASGRVTGGGAPAASPDAGNWRDHEIAALYNVLALANSGTGQITLKLSFDRGATFAQTETVPAAGAARLVQLAMAADYSLAVVFWQIGASGRSELVLVEGRPGATDPHGSPTAFAFDAPAVLHRANAGAVPLLMGVAWSEGGDLVVGHGDLTWPEVRGGRMTSRFHCAVRPWGGEFRGHLVDEESVVPRDPSVALLGSGAGLRIHYAYEVQDGIAVRESRDAGATWGARQLVGGPGASTPTIFARDNRGAARVDLIYIAAAAAGQELHAARWDAFGGSPLLEHRLTTATMTPTVLAANARWSYGHRITQLGWFGYDAVLDGDQIVVVFDEETFDAAWLCGSSPGGARGGASPGTVASPIFVPAQPPPLAPGMTEPMPAPDPEHRHQLKMVRIE